MKNYRLLALTLIPAFALAFLGAHAAQAHGFGLLGDKTPEGIATHQEAVFEHQSELTGISIETLKAGWAEGKNFWQIAEDNGVTKEELQTRMQEERQAKMKEHLSILVQQGVVTQEQADKRLSFMSAHEGEHKGEMKGVGRFDGFHKPFDL